MLVALEVILDVAIEAWVDKNRGSFSPEDRVPVAAAGSGPSTRWFAPSTLVYGPYVLCEKLPYGANILERKT